MEFKIKFIKIFLIIKTKSSKHHFTILQRIGFLELFISRIVLKYLKTLLTFLIDLFFIKENLIFCH